MNEVSKQSLSLEEAMRAEADAEAKALIAAAQAKADTIVAAAKKAARVRLKKAVRAMRVERRARLERARAQLLTAERKHRQAIELRLLAGAMGELEAALLARWQNPDMRQQWCRTVVAEASDRLEPGLWTIEHPTDWDAGADADLVELVAEASGNAPRFHADQTITAGLRVREGHAVLDGTRRGLLSRRDWVEAALLSFIDLEPEGEGSSS